MGEQLSCVFSESLKSQDLRHFIHKYSDINREQIWQVPLGTQVFFCLGESLLFKNTPELLKEHVTLN
jgi:hypothetical protein